MSEIAEQPNNSRAPRLDPLLEPGRRLLFCVAVFALSYFVCWHFAEHIFVVLIQPLLRTGQRVVYSQLFDAFFVREKVAFFSAIMVSFPIAATQLWYFVASGMYRRDRRAVLPFSLATLVLFLTGVATAYFIAVPIVLHFLLGFSAASGELPQQLGLPAIGVYFSVISRFLFAFGAAFLLPVLLMLLERAKTVNRKQLIGARRYAIVGAFVIALVLSPPDAGSLLLLAITLAVLYEAAIIGIRLIERRRACAGQVVADG